jgi:hypothetical protein
MAYSDEVAKNIQKALEKKAIEEAKPNEVLQNLKAFTVSGRKSLGEDVKGLGNVVEKLTKNTPFIPSMKNNLVQRLGQKMEGISPEEQKLLDTHKTANIVGNVTGKILPTLATSLLAPEIALPAKLAQYAPKLAMLGKVAMSGVQGVGQQAAYDALTDKGMDPTRLALSGGLNVAAKVLPSVIPSIKKLLPAKSVEAVAKSPEKQALSTIAKTPEEINAIAKQTPKKVENTVRAIDELKGQLDDLTLEHVAQNQHVRKALIEKGADTMTKESDQIAQEAANKLQHLNDNIHDIGKKFYQDAGIDFQKTKVPLTQNLDNMEAQLANKANSIAITPANKKAIQEAAEYVQGIKQTLAKKNGQASFEETLSLERELRNEAKKHFNSGDNSIGSMYSDLAKEVNQAKNAIPEIQGAGGKFKDLRQLEDVLSKATKFDTLRGQMNLKNKLLSKTFKDDKGVEVLDQVDALIKKHPELKEYDGLVDKIKEAQVGQDLAKAKEAKPVGMLNRIPALKAISELPIWNDRARIQRLAQAMESGKINPENFLNARFKSEANPILSGFGINRLKALQSTGQLPGSLSQIGKLIPNLPNMKIPNIPMPNVSKTMLARSAMNSGSIQNLVSGLRGKKNDRMPQ